MTEVFDVIPAPQRAAAARAIGDTFGDAPVQGLEVLRGGMSPALVYRVSIAGAGYVLRIVTRRNPLGDPARHHACLRIAADAGLAPPVRYTDDAAAITISDFIASRPLFECPRGELLEGLAALLRGLQATPRFPAVVHSLDAIDDLVRELRASGAVPADDAFARYAELSSAYPRRRDDLVSAHNDLNPGNVLWDGARLWLVDWEVAFANDPYADLATLCNDFAPPSAAAGDGAMTDEQRLVHAYFGGAPTPYQTARCWLMQQALLMMRAALFFGAVRAQRPALQLTVADLDAPTLTELRPQLAQLVQHPDGQLRYALGALAQFAHNARLPEHGDALARMRAA